MRPRTYLVAEAAAAGDVDSQVALRVVRRVAVLVHELVVLRHERRREELRVILPHQVVAVHDGGSAPIVGGEGVSRLRLRFGPVRETRASLAHVLAARVIRVAVVVLIAVGAAHLVAASSGTTCAAAGEQASEAHGDGESSNDHLARRSDPPQHKID